MDINNLNISEVYTLIEAEKHPKSLLKFQDVYNQIKNTLVILTNSYRCEIVDETRNIFYKLLVHTTPVETTFSISLMFLENHYHLIRFDFGKSLRHVNYIGTDHEEVVVGSHVHYNASPSKYDAKNVLPISDISEFKNIKVIKDAFLKFIDYTNIKTKNKEDSNNG